tara:strand:+ start:2907 stop:3287 length:381 start_codon:yes stop_codon:yes gene_type:complete
MKIPGRQATAEAVQDFVDHLRLTDNVRALQELQEEIAEAVGKLSNRLQALETAFPERLATHKAETQLEAIRQAQDVVYKVQGGMNERMETLAVRMSLYERSRSPASNQPTDATGGGRLDYDATPVD